MFYYEIAVASKSRGSSDTYTYSYNDRIGIGQLVIIDFRNKQCMGIAVEKVTKPSYNTKQIAKALDISIPIAHVELMRKLFQLYPLNGGLIAAMFTPPKSQFYADHNTSDIADFSKLEPLNKEQKAALEVFKKTNGSLLLHGDTGSGKTRLYSHRIKQVLDSGKNVYILGPEIGLATQLFSYLRSYFPCTLYHSALTPKQRQITWQSIAQTTSPQVVIGPRSALTTPLSNIGLIILDEAHDQSYHQDNAPGISTHVMASLLARLSSAQYVYASATPNTTDYYHADQKNRPIIRLTGPAVRQDKDVSATIHNLSYHDSQEFTGSMFAATTIKLIREALRDTGKILVLLNRRGTARIIRCNNCAWEYSCSNCDRGLIYHHDTHKAHCHFCDRQYSIPVSCPECGHAEIAYDAPGTKAVALELEKMFSGAKVQRFDTDNTKVDSLGEQIGGLNTNDTDIIVGTQMIAKGLDIPQLAVVVVLQASGSGTSDYMGEERAFQLLYQVIGRGIRGHRNTHIVLQTSRPDHPVISYATERKWHEFYEHELQQRQQFRFPPFCHMAVIKYSRSTSQEAEKKGLELITKWSARYPGVEFIGPIRNQAERKGSQFNWHIILRSNKRSYLTDISRQIGTSWIVEFDPVTTP